MKKKLVEVNEISDSIKKSFKTRTITSIVLAVLLLPAVIIGNYFFAYILVVLSFMAC